MKKHTLAEATRIICGENPRHSDPERWVADQLRSRRFRGQKIGRYWYMTAADIEAAELSLYPGHTQEPTPATEPFGVTDGLSARARRRLRSAS